MGRTVSAIAILVLSAGTSAGFESAYTELNLDACTVIAADDFAASWACPGYRGYPLYVAERATRFSISFGFGAPDEKAAMQSVPPRNHLDAMVEWRLSDESGRWLPVAAIVRYITEGRMGPKAPCSR